MSTPRFRKGDRVEDTVGAQGIGTVDYGGAGEITAVRWDRSGMVAEIQTAWLGRAVEPGALDRPSFRDRCDIGSRNVTGRPSRPGETGRWVAI